MVKYTANLEHLLTLRAHVSPPWIGSNPAVGALSTMTTGSLGNNNNNNNNNNNANRTNRAVVATLPSAANETGEDRAGGDGGGGGGYVLGGLGGLASSSSTLRSLFPPRAVNSGATTGGVGGGGGRGLFIPPARGQGPGAHLPHPVVSSRGGKSTHPHPPPHSTPPKATTKTTPKSTPTKSPGTPSSSMIPTAATITTGTVAGSAVNPVVNLPTRSQRVETSSALLSSPESSLRRQSLMERAAIITARNRPQSQPQLVKDDGNNDIATGSSNWLGTEIEGGSDSEEGLGMRLGSRLRHGASRVSEGEGQGVFSPTSTTTTNNTNTNTSTNDNATTTTTTTTTAIDAAVVTDNNSNPTTANDVLLAGITAAAAEDALMVCPRHTPCNMYLCTYTLSTASDTPL